MYMHFFVFFNVFILFFLHFNISLRPHCKTKRSVDIIAKLLIVNNCGKSNERRITRVKIIICANSRKHEML